MGMHVFLHTKPGVPAGSQIGYGSFVLFVDGESPKLVPKKTIFA